MAYAATKKTLQLYYNLLSTFAQHFTCSLQSASFMKLSEFMSKTIKLLLTELVGQYGKGRWQYIAALPSHSVSKSIKFTALFLRTYTFVSAVHDTADSQSWNFMNVIRMGIVSYRNVQMSTDSSE